MNEEIQSVVNEFNNWSSIHGYDVTAVVQTMEETGLYGEEEGVSLSEEDKDVFRNLYVLTTYYGEGEEGDRIIFTDASVVGDKINFFDKYSGIRYTVRMNRAPSEKDVNLNFLVEMLEQMENYRYISSDSGYLAEEIKEEIASKGETADISDRVSVFVPGYLYWYLDKILSDSECCRIGNLINAEADESILISRIWDVWFLPEERVSFPDINC